MSKYLPLKHYLEDAVGNEHPMTFAQIERVLGFHLPPSAREYPPFWSNSHHNPAVKAFRSAGWHSSRVDLGAEQLVFVRDAEPSNPNRRTPATVTIRLAELSAAARKSVEREARRLGSFESAFAHLLNQSGEETSRKALLNRFAAFSPHLSGDSADLIRDDRDGR